MSVCSIRKLTHNPTGAASVLLGFDDKLADWMSLDGKQLVDTTPFLRGDSVSNFPRQNESHVIEFEVEVDITDAAAAEDAMLDHPLNLPKTQANLKWEIEADFSMWPNFTTKNYLLSDDGAGNKSAWVNTGTTENSKPVYHKLESPGKGWKLASNGSQWVTSDLGVPDTGHPAETSVGNEATPDLATFGTLSFTTP